MAWDIFIPKGSKHAKLVSMELVPEVEAIHAYEDNVGPEPLNCRVFKLLLATA